MITKGRLVAASPLFLFLALGCGSKANPNAAANVYGTVTYKGQPVTGGTITFYPKVAGGPKTPSGAYPKALNPADGTYNISDVPTGELIVTVETDSVKPDVKQEQYGRGGGRGGMIGPGPRERPQPTAEPKYVKIPAKYAKKDTSPLTVTLEPGKNKKDFDLTD